MLKTYTKRILGSIAFFRALLGPVSIQPISAPVSDNLADSEQQSIGMSHAGFSLSYNAASADGTGSTTAAKDAPTTDSDLAAMLEAFLKVIYVFLWPILWIAGMAMDNSLVYGEIFGLDGALYKFRSIMKNFANFALGFLFVWSIVNYIFGTKAGKVMEQPKTMIAKLLVAGVGVQMSWFIIGALVDLSTVLTVGIGGLPLQLIGDETIANKPIYGIETSIKLNEKIGSKDNLVVLFTRPGAALKHKVGGGDDVKYLLPCYIKQRKIVWDDANNNEWKTAFGIVGGSTTITGTNVGREEVVSDYCIVGGQVVGQAEYVAGGNIDLTESEAMRDIYNKSLASLRQSACSGSNVCQTIASFTKKTEGYQGAFYSLYSSLLNLSTIHIGVPKSEASLVMETLIKTIIALAYLIPLAILAIVLIMRVGYLWLIIAFSPFIVLASVKDLGIGGLKEGMSIGGIKAKFNLTNVISLLLLPVIVTFVICLSIVFLSSLSEGLTTSGTSESIGIYQRTEGSYKCYDVAITSICIDMPSRDIGTGIFDYFSWMIMNLFGVGLMWFAVMAALKSSKFTEGVAKGVQDLSQSMLMSAPIIPLGKDKGTSLSALSNFSSDLKTDITSSDKSKYILSDVVKSKYGNLTGKDKSVEQAVNTTLVSTPTNNDEFVKKFVGNVGAGAYAADPGSSMNAGQVKGMEELFTRLAASVGVKDAKFTKGQNPFTTEKGQEVLGKIYANEAKYGKLDMGKLRDMYSSAQTDMPAWSDDKEGYEKDIIAYSKKIKVDADAALVKSKIEKGETRNGKVAETKIIAENNVVYVLTGDKLSAPISANLSEQTKLADVKTGLEALNKVATGENLLALPGVDLKKDIGPLDDKKTYSLVIKTKDGPLELEEKPATTKPSGTSPAPVATVAKTTDKTPAAGVADPKKTDPKTEVKKP